MRTRIALVAVAILAIIAFTNSPRAYAHVLIHDTGGANGAILHIVPDDDPIAGKKATLFFDMQARAGKDTKVNLTIRREGADEAVPVKTSLDGSLATADFIFPSQGVYYLEYEVKSANTVSLFKQSTRVSRGTVVGAVNKPRHGWAEGLLVACAGIIAALAVVAFNRRHDIAKQSRF